MELLKIDSINCGYKKKPVLYDLSLSVNSDEIVSIIGPNGAGKSTILKTIIGLIPLWSGNIYMNQTSIKNNSIAQNIIKGIRYCPQGNKVFTEMSVIDNLKIGSFNLPTSQLKEQISKILEIFPILKNRLKEFAGNLSGGEQQMLALSRTLISPPKLLLLDEPSLGLAPNLLGDVFNKLVEINQEYKISMLIVEQKVMKVFKISNRTYSIKLGKVIFEGKPHELIGNRDKLKRLFL